MQLTDGARGRGGGPSASCACRYRSLLHGSCTGICIRLGAVWVGCFTFSRRIEVRGALTRQALGAVTKAGLAILPIRLGVLAETILALIKAILTLAEAILALIKAILAEAVILTKAILLTKAVLLLGLRHSGFGMISRLARC